MKRCSFCEWIPILPWPVWPLAGQCSLGQNIVVGSMLCSSWLCVTACQKEYVGIPIFVTSELHHGSVQSYRRQLSTPATRYPGRRRSVAPGLAAERPTSCGTGRGTARWHRRTIGCCRYPVTPHEAEGPTNGGHIGDGPASKTRPTPY